MTEKNNQVSVSIMGQPYKLACKEDEQTVLMQAAVYLDEKMNHFREVAKIKGTDRIAVMAALAIATELLAIKAPEGSFSELNMAQINQQIQCMNNALDEVLTTQENLF